MVWIINMCPFHYATETVIHKYLGYILTAVVKFGLLKVGLGTLTLVAHIIL